jgi:hypothetical protein
MGVRDTTGMPRQKLLSGAVLAGTLAVSLSAAAQTPVAGEPPEHGKLNDGLERLETIHEAGTSAFGPSE